MSDLNFTADLEDGISSKLRAIEQNLQRFKQTAADAGGKLDSIRASSEKVTNAFTVMGAAITTAFIALGLGAASSSKELVGVARELGIATSEVLALNKAVVAAGGSADRTQDLLRNMSESILEAQVDGADSDKAKAFAALGFTPNDLRTASQDLTGFIAEFYKRIEQTQSNAVRTMVTQTLVGAAGELLDPAQLSKTFAPDPAAAKAFETLNTAVNKFSTVIGGLQEAVAKGVEPMAAAFNKLPAEDLEKFYKGVEMITGAVISLVMALPGLVSTVPPVIASIKLVGEVMATTSSRLVSSLGAIANFVDKLVTTGRAAEAASKAVATLIYVIQEAPTKVEKFANTIGKTIVSAGKLTETLIDLSGRFKIITKFGNAALNFSNALKTVAVVLNDIKSGVIVVGSAFSKLIAIVSKFAPVVGAFLKFIPVLGTIIMTVEVLWKVFKDVKASVDKFGFSIQTIQTFVVSLVIEMGDLLARLGGIYDVLKDLFGLDLGWWDVLVNKIREGKQAWLDLIDSTESAAENQAAQQLVKDAQSAKKAAEDRAQAIANGYKHQAKAADKAAKATRAQAEEAARVAAETGAAIANAVAAVAVGFASFRAEHTRFVEDLERNQSRALDDIAMLGESGEWVPVDAYQRTLNQLNRANEDFYVQRKRQLQDQIKAAEASRVGTTDKAQIAAANETVRLATIELGKLDEKQVALENIAKANAREITALQSILDLRAQEIERMQAIRDTTEEFLKGVREAQSASIFEGSLRGMTELEAGMTKINQDHKLAIQAAKESIGYSDSGQNTPEQEAALQRMVTAQKELTAARQADLMTANSWSAGWDSAFVAYFDNLSNASKIAAEQMNVIGSAMTSALDGFLETGKINFKSFTADIIRGLLKISIQAEIAERALAMRNAFKGGGSIFGALLGGVMGAAGGMMGAAGGMAAGTGSMGVTGDYFGGVSDWASNSFAGKATGGPVKAGVPYMTGESGRELFMPSTDGTIITNAKLNAMMAQQPVAVGSSGTNVVNNISISAIDSRGVAQFFAENKRLLSGAVDSARRDQGRK